MEHKVVSTTMRSHRNISDPFPAIPTMFYRQFPLYYFQQSNGIWNPEYKTAEDYLRNSVTRFVKISTTPELPKNTCGIELELPMEPRQMHIDRFNAFYKPITLLTGESVVRAFLHDMTYRSWQFLVEPPHTDAGSEFVFTPMTLEAIQHLEPFWNEMFAWLREHGYHEVQQGSGIHMNIDYEAFGDTDEEICAAFERFLWFFFENRTWYTSFSGRWGSSSANSDSHVLYSIPMAARIAERKEREALFRDVKISQMADLREVLTRAPGNGRSEISRHGNISLGRDGRRCFEFRHFSSTVWASTFLEMIEGMYCIIELCKTDLPSTVESLCQVAIENSDKYPRFFAYLMDTPYTESIINNLAMSEMFAN